MIFRSTLIIVSVIGLFCRIVLAEEGGSCTTPNGEAAKCVSVFSCKLLLALTRKKDAQTVKFISESQCGFGETPLVCCGTYATYQTTTPASIQAMMSSMTMRDGSSSMPIAERQRCGFMQGQMPEAAPEDLYPTILGYALNPIRMISNLFSGHEAVTQSSVTADNRVLSGANTEIDEFPWMALLQYKAKDSNTEKLLCGGSLIGPRYVLTAAHCVKGSVTEKHSLKNVRLGEWNTDTEKDCIVIGGEEDCSDPHVNIDIEEIIPHSQYDENSVHRYDDIALLRLKERVNYTDFIRPICLPTAGDNTRIGKELTVAGWGKTLTQENSNIKQKLRIPRTSTLACRRIFGPKIVIGNSQICAGGEVNKDTCTGDSGGPLMNILNDSPGQWYIEGVVSFGSSCGKQGWPGVYTKVYDYVEWIQSHVRD